MKTDFWVSELIIGIGSGSGMAGKPLGRGLRSTDPGEGLLRLCSRVCSRVFPSVAGCGEVFGRLHVCAALRADPILCKSRVDGFGLASSPGPSAQIGSARLRSLASLGFLFVSLACFFVWRCGARVTVGHARCVFPSVAGCVFMRYE